jgi:hypothetical protein
LLDSLTGAQILALTLYGEARGESPEGRLAVACVVRNRMRERRQTAGQVCLARLQFSCWSPAGGAQNYATVMELADRVAAGTVTLPAYTDCLIIAEAVLSDAADDVTHGATHYMTIGLFDSPACPWWARQMRETERIGRHVFLSDRPLP